jgi:hypothetical protein
LAVFAHVLQPWGVFRVSEAFFELADGASDLDFPVSVFSGSLGVQRVVVCALIQIVPVPSRSESLHLVPDVIARGRS